MRHLIPFVLALSTFTPPHSRPRETSPQKTPAQRSSLTFREYMIQVEVQRTPLAAKAVVFDLLMAQQPH